jgi:hypothetical protein
MNTITKDQWDESIWGVEHPDTDSSFETPKLVFYFGQNVSLSRNLSLFLLTFKDHWVADHTRDTLIAARARDENKILSSKPWMLIDQDGVPHAFCIST